jgi:asparagine synthase (glutamine-hydrolysing)
MCGITGIVCNYQPRNFELRATAVAMADCLTHRGPNSGGCWSDEKVALGHRRLSVLDLSDSGLQPMMSSNERFVVSFNGELYNHVDIRKDLLNEGTDVKWRGHSDTETLIEAIAFWGLETTVNKINGMFAFALWDRRSEELSLVRDRYGEKPVYWGYSSKSFVFASELKALRAIPTFSKEISTDALSLYFEYGYVPAPWSIHPSIYKLEPGCILTLQTNQPFLDPKYPLRPGEVLGPISIKRYWSLKEEIETGTKRLISNQSEAITYLKKNLQQSVKERMISDVPMGAFLSGGIDSSLITAIMQEQSHFPINTFTAGFENHAFNEAPYARQVAEHLSTNHHEIIVTEKDSFNVIPILPAIYDEPFADPSQIPTYLISKFASTKITVALSGDGGDEFFGGYTRYNLVNKLALIYRWCPYVLRKYLGILLLQVNSACRKSDKFIAVNSNLLMKIDRLAARLLTCENLEQLKDSFVKICDQDNLLLKPNIAEFQELCEEIPQVLKNAPSDQMMFRDILTYLPDDILCKVDRASMATSLEVRSPFLDPKILKVSAQLPQELKMTNKNSKIILRKILQDYVPSQILDRPKTGFGIPLAEWLRGPLRIWAEDLLAESSLKENQLDIQSIKNVWAEHLSYKKDWSQQIWTVLMFIAWQKSI